MKMDWNYIRPQCAKSSVAALAFATLIHFTSPVHFLVAAAILLLAGPVTDIIIESIATRNPAAGERIFVKDWWSSVVFFGVVIIISVVLRQWVPLPFMTAFAYALLLWSAVGAINAIVIEWEDNTPGGWLNPNGRK